MASGIKMARLVAAGIGVMLLAACGTASISTENGRELPAEFREGRGYYLRSCRTCHGLYRPAERSRQQWSEILARKRSKVSLTETQFSKLTAYVFWASAETGR